MQVNPEDSPAEIYVTWSDPRMTDFENSQSHYSLYGYRKIRWMDG